MKANELRIGNYVFHKENVLRITNIIDFCVNMEFGEQSGERNDEIDIDEISPIPLTPELLEKCGFKKGNICYNNGYSIELLKTDFYLRPSYEGGFYWGFNESKQKKDCELNDVKSIHYLHQLQNFYYALIGEELNIEL